ncbi:hypothetical protein KDJ57_gp30 [Gordonia phage Catfish]|uniref:Uncharacterized protein n=1 Tax=Gordonia phage Catfish TaxID=2301538 RepID=A0A385D107_9CAUD|nr:hypothetical protein KDJ57_gp30 [Gordonia phage Catfish]AXQ51915.1 hypothetical protein SEA_CATFISH_79 [Gordonia phage Catfish]
MIGSGKRYRVRPIRFGPDQRVTKHAVEYNPNPCVHDEPCHELEWVELYRVKRHRTAMFLAGRAAASGMTDKVDLVTETG